MVESPLSIDARMRWRALFLLVSALLLGATWRAVEGDRWFVHYLEARR